MASDNEEGMYSMGGSQNSFTDRPINKLHKFYLVGEIGIASEYVQWFETIRNAGEQDIIYIHINSEGGNLFTAIQFLRVLGETKGTVIASVEGLCMSAATIIFMAAKHHEITNHSIFMFHNYSSVTAGKGGEMHDQIIHFRAWSENLLKDIYGAFLTPDEVASILDGKDLYMRSEEVAERLEIRNIEISKIAEQMLLAQSVPEPTPTPPEPKAKRILLHHKKKKTPLTIVKT